MPLLTIVVPVYNAEKTLGRAINSVLTQTFTDWEMILIDDGSVDQSGKICDSFADKYNNIVCFHQENRGLSAARNVGIHNATGKYLVFLDSDDWIEENYYLELVRAQEETLADLVMSGYTREFWRVNQCRKKIHIASENEMISFQNPESSFFNNIFSYNLFIHVWNKLYLRNTLEHYHIYFDETLRFAEDVPFNLQYYQKIERIFITNQTGYHYICLNNGSLTSKWTADLVNANCRTYRLIRDFLIDKSIIGAMDINRTMYLRGCFLNFEKALARKMPYKQFSELVLELYKVEETLEVINLGTNNNGPEFLIYSTLLRLKHPSLIYMSVRLRRGIKYILGRL